MYKIYLLLLFIFLSGCRKDDKISSIELNHDTEVVNQLLSSHQDSLHIIGNAYFFGDSITQGTGADPDKSWVSLVSKFTGLTGANLGIGGTTLEKYINGIDQPSSMYERAATEIPVKQGGDKFLFLAYGVNDINILAQDLTTENFISDYQYILSVAFKKGWKPQEIVILNTYYYSLDTYFNTNISINKDRQVSFNTAIENVAVKNGSHFIDIYTFMYNNGKDALLGADNLHPNELGYAVIAREVEESLRNY